MKRWGLFEVALLAMVVSGCTTAQSVKPVSVRDREVARVAVAVAPAEYDRREWRHWTDADHDCQNTRQEVLIAESEVPVEFVDARHCKVKWGRWTCPYTGRTVTDPAELDIDHLVPLENACHSGGWRWSRGRKAEYANDLYEPEHLVAVVASANRSKGSRGPDEWLPANVSFVCEYVREWRSVKARWGLSMSDAERRRSDDVLTACSR